MKDEQKTVEGLSRTVVGVDSFSRFPLCSLCKKPIIGEWPSPLGLGGLTFHRECLIEWSERGLAWCCESPATTLRDTE